MRVGLCVLAAAVVVAVPTASAAGALPIKGKTYSGYKYFTFKVNKDLSLTYKWTHDGFPKNCDPGTRFTTYKSFIVHPDGSFGFQDLGFYVDVTVAGKFTSPTHASGTVHIVDNDLKHGCHGFNSRFSLNAA